MFCVVCSVVEFDPRCSSEKGRDHLSITVPQDDAGPARQAAASLRARLRIKSMQLYKEERRGLMGPQRQAYAAELRERQRGDG